jgi:hypothetical protein
MSGMRGVLFDGKNSARREVSLVVAGERLWVRGEGCDASYPLAKVAVAPRLGTIRRALIFPDGARCEIDGDVPLDTLLERRQGRFAVILHRWETSLPRVIVALFLIIATVWGVVKYGLPVAARKVAFAVPPVTEVALGRKTLELLDRSFLSPSRLPETRRAELTELFRGITRELPGGEGCRLEFRASDRIGANAFALPSGIVVVTDGLVELAKNDAGLVGVLAHEMGHVSHRHALRQVLQNSATGLVVATITGDILSVSSLAATLPTVLIDAKFSRDFETDADDEAVAYLKKHGIPVGAYAEMLASLEADHTRREGNEANGRRQIGDFFSTHPVTRDRINRIIDGR